LCVGRGFCSGGLSSHGHCPVVDSGVVRLEHFKGLRQCSYDRLQRGFFTTACIGRRIGILVIDPLLRFLFAMAARRSMGPYAAEVWPSALRHQRDGLGLWVGGMGRSSGPFGLSADRRFFVEYRPSTTVNDRRQILPSFPILRGPGRRLLVWPTPSSGSGMGNQGENRSKGHRQRVSLLLLSLLLAASTRPGLRFRYRGRSDRRSSGVTRLPIQSGPNSYFSAATCLPSPNKSRKISAQAAPAHKARSWFLSGATIAIEVLAFAAPDASRGVVFRLWSQYGRRHLFALVAAYRRSSVIPAASRATGFASISMADPGARPHLQICTPTPARRFGAYFTESRDATCCALTRWKVSTGALGTAISLIAARIDRYMWSVWSRPSRTWLRVYELDWKAVAAGTSPLLRDGARAHRSARDPHPVFWRAFDARAL